MRVCGEKGVGGREEEGGERERRRRKKRERVSNLTFYIQSTKEGEREMFVC